MEYRRLLVPLDGSASAEAVLPAVEAVARRAGSTIVLMHVLEAAVRATVHGESHLSDAGEAESYIAGVADRLRAEGLIVETHVHEAREGDVARSIAEHADEFKPDLVVLCAHGPGGLKGFLSGRVGQQVLQHTALPILLLHPPKRRENGFDLRKVVVALDDSPQHQGALEAATPMAKLFGAELHLCYVVPTVGTVADERARPALLMPNAMREILEMARQRGTEFLEGVAGSARAQGLTVAAEVLRGNAVGALLRRVKKLRADLLVTAGHGRAGLPAFLSGSVGARLAAQADTPLLLVRSRDDSEPVPSQ